MHKFELFSFAVLFILIFGCTQTPKIQVNKTVGNLTEVFDIPKQNVSVPEVKNETVKEQPKAGGTKEAVVEPQDVDKVTLTFTATVPEFTPQEDKVFLVLKDFTNYQKQRIEMDRLDARRWAASIKVQRGSIVRYIYDRGLHADDPYNRFPRGKKESFSKDVQITFRYAYANSGSNINDIVAEWEDIHISNRSSGSIEGYVKDRENNPVIDATVSIAGVHLGTDYEGRFKLSGIPAGVQNVVVSTNNGAYKYLAQSIEIRENQEAVMTVSLERARKILVTFNAEVPDDTPKYAEIRVFGNLGQLGSAQWYRNSIFPTPLRFIALNRSGDSFRGSVELYENSYVEYVYSLGSATSLTEVTEGGSDLVRSFVVGSENQVRNDRIDRWRIGNQDATTLIVSFPNTTPQSDPILFVSGGYIKMHRYGNTQWALPIYDYKPENYYFARGIVPDGNEVLINNRTIKTDTKGDISITNLVASWVWLSDEVNQRYELKPLVTPTAREFVNGVTLTGEYSPDFLPLYSTTFEHARANNISWIGVPLPWQMSSIDTLPEIELRSIKNYALSPSLSDMKTIVNEAHEKDLRVILHARIVSKNTKGNIAQPHSNEWYDRYLQSLERALMFNALMANESNADMLIIPGVGNLQFQNSSYKDVFDRRMQGIIDRMRERYYGKIVSDDSYEAAASYEYFKKLDYVGLYWFEKLNIRNDASVEEIEVAINSILDSKYMSIYNRTNKSIVITQFAYASVDGSVNQVPDIPENLQERANVKLDVEEQARVYEAFFRAAANRKWIRGMLSSNYDLIDQPMSKSFSIRAKPAEAVLSSYYSVYVSEGKNLTQVRDSELEGLEFADYKLVLLDLTVPVNGISCASMGIYSRGKEQLGLAKVCPGESYKWIAPDGRVFRIVAYKTSPGYLLKSIWAEVAVFG